MLTGSPVLRHTFVGLGVVSLAAIQFAPASTIRQLAAPIAFQNGIHLFWGIAAVLQLAQVERVIGSSAMLSRFTFGSLVSLGVNFFVKSVSLPCTLLFSLAPAFIAHVPPQRKINVASKLTLSEKCFQYLLFHQLATFDPASAVTGLALGILMFDFKQEFVSFTPESDVTDPIGATREIQRKIQLDREEEAFTRAQMARFAQMPRQPVRRTVPQPLNRLRPNVAPAAAAAPPPPPYSPSDEEVASLVAMGFETERVRRALVQHRGDLTGAAEQLIREN